MLDTNFPRFVGDIGNPATFEFPVRYEVISNASPHNIVRKDHTAMLPVFIEAARKLENEGAKLITTSCGFLCLFQKQLQGAVSIPVLTSSLFMWQEIQRSLKPEAVTGILTISKSSLTQAHLTAASIPEDVPVGSTEYLDHFSNSILSNSKHLDYKLSEKDNVNAALALKSAHPNLGAILLECTNMPPHTEAIFEATELPVYSLNDGVRKLWNSLN